MNAGTATPTRFDDRRRRLRQARAFFLIAVVVTALSVAQHCLPGDDADAAVTSAIEAPAR